MTPLTAEHDLEAKAEGWSQERRRDKSAAWRTRKDARQREGGEEEEGAGRPFETEKGRDSLRPGSLEKRSARVGNNKSVGQILGQIVSPATLRVVIRYVHVLARVTN